MASWWGHPLCRQLFSQPGTAISTLALLWSVLVCQLEQLRSCWAVQGLGKLVNGRRHFQALIENSPWLLQLGVGGHLTKQ